MTQAGATFSGSLTIGKAQFKFTAVKGDKSQTRFLAAYTDTGGDSISVKDLVAAVSPDAAAETPDIEVELKDVIFAMAAGDPSPRFLFAFDLKRIELSALPLVGAKLADSVSVDDLQVVAATATPVAAAGSDPGDVAAWNALLPDPATKLPSDGIVRGVLMSAKLQLGIDSVAVALAPPAPLPTTKKPSDTPAAAADSTKWFPVQRACGPVYFNRVGARYDAGALWLLLDASLAFDGLSLTLDGLGVGSELSAFDPKFHLDGIGISYRQDPVEIAGAFLAVPSAQLGNATFEYDGAAVVRAEDFTLAAIGSYAEVAGHPSMFVFADFAHALGGPPAAYVTGLMGGFGYNRALRIPAQDEVSQFPFVHGLDAGAPGDGTPIGVLKVLEGDGTSQATPWLTDSLGDNWLAVGVRFTSFGLAETYALLIAEFGNELQFALVGLTTLRLPQDTSEKAFAYVELEVEAVLKPRDGFFGLTAVLSPNSFVFAPECRITGGFAFYVWYDGDHAGDFVVTLGGYHPAFAPPAWYPQEPRLALTWPVSDLVTIDGSAYFALTPTCVMGGGGLHVLFHDGNLQAWLTASADFLISWAPFHYTGGVGVSVGVSYRVDWAFVQKTFSIELAAQLSLEGPPTHGRAYISWWVISFSIEFGDQSSSTDSVKGWDDFAKLLPAKDDLCKVVIQSGLLPGSTKEDAVVRADALQIATECAVPATQLELATGSDAFARPVEAPAIRPLGLATIESTQTLHVQDANGNEIDVLDKQHPWTIAARTRNVPQALWGPPLDGDPPPDAKLVPQQLIGFTITPPVASTAGSCGPVDMAKAFSGDPVASGVLPLSSAQATAPGAPADNAVAEITGESTKPETGIAGTKAVGARAAIRSVLEAQGFDPGSDDGLATFAAKADALFPLPPMLCGTTT